MLIWMLGLLIPRVCLRLVGWSSASLTELCSYWRSVSRTSRDPSRYSSNQLTTPGRGGGTGSLDADHTSSHRCGANHRTAPGRSTSSLGWGDSCRWCCLVTRGSGQPWQHSEKRKCRINSSETVDFNLCLSWCQSSEGVPGLLPAPAQRRLRALHPRRELPRPSDGLAAQKGRGLCDPERTARRRCSSSGL